MASGISPKFVKLINFPFILILYMYIFVCNTIIYWTTERIFSREMSLETWDAELVTNIFFINSFSNFFFNKEAKVKNW